MEQMGVNVAKQMALIKPDDVYDRWYHKDTRVKYGTGSRVTFMLAVFVSAGFDNGWFVYCADICQRDVFTAGKVLHNGHFSNGVPDVPKENSPIE
jgi:hypothetical protein